MYTKVQNKEKLLTLRHQIPFGGLKEISKAANCSRVTLDKFFKGELKRLDKISDIQCAVLKYLEENKRKSYQFFNSIENI